MSPSARVAANRWISAGAARTQPTRSPPQNDLDTDPSESTLVPDTAPDPVSKAAIGGGSGSVPGNGTSRNDSSASTSDFADRAAATTDSRVAASISAPVGFWKSGMRYASRAADWR